MKQKIIRTGCITLCILLSVLIACIGSGVQGRKSAFSSVKSGNLTSGITDLISKGSNRLATEAKKGNFIYGVNVPWVSIGSDFGADSVALLENGDSQPNYSEDAYERIFANCKAIGYNGIRLWLLTKAQGIRFTKYGDVLGLDGYFLDNLKKTLDLAVKYGIPLDITLQPRMFYAYEQNDKRTYDLLTQFIVNPEYRKNYLQKVVVPICKVLDGYRDTVLSVTVYAGPESDIYGENNFLYGTDWETVSEFIAESCKTVRNALPDMPISVSAQLNGFTTYDYSDLDIDLLGVSVYNNTGATVNPKEINAVKPMWIGECGPDITYTRDNSDDSQTEIMMNFYENAKSNGYLGAFWWAYNYVLPYSVIFSPEDYSGLRPAAVVLHNALLDNYYDENGIDPDSVADKPSLLYSDDPVFLKWIGCRDVESYKIEYSRDGNTFDALEDNIDPNAVTDEFGICAYSLENMKIANCNYTYRITVNTFSGFSAVSDKYTYYFPKVTVPEDENIVTNPKFETGNLDGWISNGDVSVIDTASTYHISNNTAWLTAGSKISQVINVEKNTRFIFSMRLRTTTKKDSAKLCIYGGDNQEDLIAEFTVTGVETWDKSITKLFDSFNTGNNTELKIEISNVGSNMLALDDVAFGKG